MTGFAGSAWGKPFTVDGRVWLYLFVDGVPVEAHLLSCLLED